MSARTHRQMSTPPRRIAGRAAVLLLCLITALSVTHPATAAPLDAWTSEYAGAGNATHNPGEAVITAANASRVSQAWSLTGYSSARAPAIVGGVVYHVKPSGDAWTGGWFIATSARTGATLWRVQLPARSSYGMGQTVVGNLAVLPFTGYRQPGGVTAIDLQTRQIAWTRFLPDKLFSWTGNETAGPVTVDAGRVFVRGADRIINAYRLSDGAPLWELRWDGSTRVRGMAAAGGTVYTGGDDGTVAYDGASGRRLWSAPGWGVPVVAGGRILSASPGRITAVSATGCGRTTCPALWTRKLGLYSSTPVIGGVDGSTLFAVHLRADERGEMLARLSASTGAVQWQRMTSTRGSMQPVRAGNTVWLKNEYVTPDNSVATRLMAFPATGTGTAPLRIIPLPREMAAMNAGGIAVAGGTVVVQHWPSILTGYRVPGT